MNKKMLIGVVLLVVISLLIYFYFSKDGLNNQPTADKNKNNNGDAKYQEDNENASGLEGSSGSSISGFGTLGEGESESEIISEQDCTGNIDFSTEININNEETTTDDEVVLVMQNNDNSIYQNFNVYVDNVFEGAITLNGGGIANIISNEMTNWWQSLDLSQVVSRTFNVILTNDDDCEVTNSITLNYPYEGAPWD